jgi:Fe-S oxidoreductase
LQVAGAQIAGSESPESQLQPDNLKPETSAVTAALDLCLSCKACSTECASGVDMAKLKSEFMQQVYDEHGVPARAWLFGRIARLSAIASRAPSLANAVLRWPLSKRLLGVALDRDLPQFATRTFEGWWRGRQTHSTSSGQAAGRRSDQGRSTVVDRQSSVVVFIDTFTRYNHPHVGIAAARVLEMSGYAVEIAQAGCCGRPLISQGQPRAARALARELIAALKPYAEHRLPILLLEPSCLSALTDDYLDLLDDATLDDARKVAQAAHGIEDFLADSASFKMAMAALPTREPARPLALLHGHCHQKALWGTAGARRMLALAGYDTREIESTCCGMAGAFGYEAEHAALSRQIGELALLPAVRAAPMDAAICAAGTSCREQIAGLAGRDASHPIELAALRMTNDE